MSYILRWLVAACACVWAGQATAAWHEARSKHFIIYSDDKPRNLQAFAEKLERFDAAVRFLRKMEDPPLTDSGKVTIFLLPDDDALQQLAQSRSVLGMYPTRASGSYAFVPRNSGRGLSFESSANRGTEKSSLDTDAIFFHEYAHHLQLQDWPGVMPPWVREGFAEFFASADIDERGNVTIGKFPSWRSQEVYFGGGLSAEEMVAADLRKLNWYEVSDLYGRSWLLTHYLSVSGKRPGQLNRYLDGIEGGAKLEDAAAAAFGDLKILSRDLNDYLKPRSFLAYTVDAAAIPIGAVKTTPLSAGASAMMNVLIRSKLKAYNLAGIAGDARRIAAAFPNDAFVQGALAEAEYDANNFSAAAAAADRVLAADPNNVQGLIYKGRAEMKLALSQGGSADWAKIRTWFTKANKLDTENSEALMLFYDSYIESNQQGLTSNAIDALLYAADLAPRDRELRLKAVRQLLAGNRVKEARERFAPAAFETHAELKWRTAAQTVVDAMDAGNAPRAAELLDQALKAEHEK